MTSDDILQFGMIPELVGRLPVISALKPLDEGALVRVLTEPKNALIKQYQELFSMENAELKFTEGALQAIAAQGPCKGHRRPGLRSIIEEVMLDIMYELPDQPPEAEYMVTEDVVMGTKPLFAAVKKIA